LTYIDVPWEKDDLRTVRESQVGFAVFKDTLIKNNKPFITLSGDQESRLKKAVVIIDTLAAANKIGFTTQDFVQIYNHGIPLTILWSN
jgi:nicotinamide riboside kinase